MGRLAAVLCLGALGFSAFGGDKSATFFDDSSVKEIRLYFDDANWYQTLYAAHTSSPDTYFPAKFVYGDTVIDQIGVRFKGNASFPGSSSVKKICKLDFNKYDDTAKFLGLKKLNLNNGDLQPDFLREKLTLDFFGKYITALRAVHTRVYVNDTLWGLYIAVEEPDKTMMQNRFGDDEAGNLYEAGENGATLAYLGTNASSYTSAYELMTNEETGDYADLINFTNILNNTATASLPDALEPICNVDNMLYGLALEILFVNLDAYIGSGSEYDLYHRTDTDQFIRIHWDMNESFGTTGDGSPSISVPAQLSVFYTPSSTSSGGGGGSRPGSGSSGGGASSSSSNTRPLATKLWAVDSYKRRYLRMMAQMLRDGFNTTAMSERITELADIIRTDVYADPNKFYTNAQFETALNSSVGTLQGLNSFVSARYTYVRSALDSYAAATDLRLNEIVALNPGSTTDEGADADPWIEIYNLGPGTVSLSGLYLTDDSASPTKWALPSESLADGAYKVFWMDNETAEGTAHASFTLNLAGGSLYLYSVSNGTATLIDSVEYPALASGKSYIRTGDTGSSWEITNQLTPAAANATATAEVDSVTIYINEFMAENTSTIQNTDNDGTYSDWIELYNPGTADIDLGGMYLTDDATNPTKFQIPTGVSIPAGGYLLFWADEKTELGSLHTNFKLGKSGEDLYLYHRDGTTKIDGLSFGAQTADVSYGRTPDGGETWTTFTTPTPGSKNQ